MESSTSTALVIGLGSAALVFFVMLIVIITSASKRRLLEKENKLHAAEKQKQVDLFRAVVEAEENQKAKIAANLHDEIIPIVAFTARSISSHINELENKGIAVSGLKKDMESFSALSDNIREIAHGLVPGLFNSFGLLKSIEAFIRQMNDSGSAAAEFYTDAALPAELPLSKNDQLIIYRVCLEILNNLFKHAGYDYLQVTVEDLKENFTLVFAHDGRSISNEEIAALTGSGRGLGLKSLQSRIMLLSAKIDYSADAGVSYIKLVVPLK